MPLAIPVTASLREGGAGSYRPPSGGTACVPGSWGCIPGRKRDAEVTCECLPLIHISIHLKSHLASLKPPLGGHKDEWCHGAVEAAL